MKETKGSRWHVGVQYGPDASKEDPTCPGRWIIEFDDANIVSCIVSDDEGNVHGTYKTRAKAEAAAGELNRLDFQGPIPPEFVERRKRLKKLAPYYRSWAYTSQEGPPEGRWPANPDRYLIMDGGVGWHAESWEYLVPDRAAIEEHLRQDDANVYQIIDLDTGKEVPFTREINVSVDLP